MANLKRIYLLPEAEIADLYARPVFNKSEQNLYFEMNQAELDLLRQFGTTRTKVYFILQLAYFKAKNQFFTFKFDDVSSDVRYILGKFFKKEEILLGSITRQCVSEQKQEILTLFNYQDWSAKQSILIEEHICELLRYYPKGHDTFRQLIAYLDNKRIVIPTYRNLQDLFTKAFAKENDRIAKLMALIPKIHQEQLIALISRGEGITEFNTIRTDQKNFTYTATSDEIDKALAIAELYLTRMNFRIIQH